MKLFYQELGEGPPLIIIHGLYGASDNWRSIAKNLASHFRCILIDQRNHGKSPHDDFMDFELMAGDVVELMEDLNIKEASIMGHSMGGKTAMWLALHYPEKLKNLVVVDIAPRSYLGPEHFSTHFEYHKGVLDTLSRLDLSQIESREDAAKKLQSGIEDTTVVQFLLKSLKRNMDKKFEWNLNIEGIYRNLRKIINGFDADKLSTVIPGQTRTLFIRGDRSDYILKKDHELLKKHFINHELTTIENAGHWVHAEAPEEFVKISLNFLLKK